MVVPALARVMHFGRPGGRNWMWTDPTCPETYQKNPPADSWPNWGGDNTWLAPQSEWPVLAGQAWPPDTAWGDPLAAPHQAALLADGGLRVTGPVSAASGLRLSRDCHLDGSEWITRQTVENVSGPTRTCALWSITDIARPETTYFVPPLHGCRLLGGDHAPDPSTSRAISLLAAPDSSHQYKIGLDSPVAAIAARFGNELLIQRAEHPPGHYPDGGVCVEYYDHGGLRPIPSPSLNSSARSSPSARGESSSLTMRWNIETLGDPPDSPHALARIHSSLHRPI